MASTEDFYKIINDRLYSFAACKRHCRQVSLMLGTMSGSSIDINEGEWLGTDTEPCIVCESRRPGNRDDGLIKILYDVMQCWTRSE